MRPFPLVAMLLAACSSGPGRVDLDDLIDEDGDGWFLNDPEVRRQDCDDRPGVGVNVNPDADEVCDRLDNDCDGTVDEEGALGALEFWPDDDADGFGKRVQEPRIACTQPEGFSVNTRDCNDTDGLIYPGAPERCNDKDDSCDGIVDEGFDAEAEWHLDLDRDGFGSETVAGVGCNTDPLWVRDATDCNDVNARVNPDAIEVCDGVDNDCDRLLDGSDTDVVGTRTWYRDADADAYGNLLVRLLVCPTAPNPAGYVLNADDCNDADGLQNPTTTWYRDGDRDGFGVAGDLWPTPQCWQPAGYAIRTGDCNDADPQEWDTKLWYGDADRDGVGVGQPVAQGCGRREGWVAINGDCRDRDPAVNPFAIERCNGIDDDCDARTDDADTNVVGLRAWYPDNDGDTWGANVGRVEACNRPANHADRRGDCNDREAALNPGTLWFRDADRDGFGDPDSPFGPPSCGVVPGHVANSEDCDDTDYDQNANTPWWGDVDGDGVGAGLNPTSQGCLAGTPGLAPVPGDCNDADATDDEGGCFGPKLGNITLTVVVDRDANGVLVRVQCLAGGTTINRALTNNDRQRTLTLVSGSLTAGDRCFVSIDTPGIDLSGDGLVQASWSTCATPVDALTGLPQATATSPEFLVERCSGCKDPAAWNYDASVIIVTNPQSCIYLD